MPQKNPFQWDYSYSFCSLLSCLKVPLDVFPHRYCLTDQNRWSSLIIRYHHWGHAQMDWDNPHSKPPFLWLLHLFYRSYLPYYVMSYYTLSLYECLLCLWWFFWVKREASIFLPAVDGRCRFQRKGVYRNAEHNGKVQNVVASCFTCQTVVTVHVFSSLFLIDSCRFHNKGYFSGCRTKWWRLKCENGTDQSIKYWKMLALLPVWRAKTEGKPFWTSPFHSTSLETPFLWKRHGSTSKRREDAGTSCFVRDNYARHSRHEYCAIVCDKPWDNKEDNSHK